MLALQANVLRGLRLTAAPTNIWNARRVAPAATNTPNWRGERQLHVATRPCQPQKSIHRLEPRSMSKLLLPGVSWPYAARFEGTAATLAVATKPADVAAKTLVELPDIPAAPGPPETAIEPVTQALNALGEPTLASLGMGGWTPSGMVQSSMEFLHVTCDLPWWGTIVVGTLVVRTLVLPIVLIAQRNAAKLHNLTPEMQVLQMKLSEARKTGDALSTTRYSQELMLFMNERGINPLKNMIVPLAQAPLFLSFFYGLREMANTPVLSMREGGLFWFTDLTVADPYYMLPLITSLTLWCTIEVGADSAKITAQNSFILKYGLRAIPLVVFPFTMNFPAAILCYWASSNFVSLGQALVLKIPAVRTFFKIEQLIKHPPSVVAPTPNKGFVAGAKETYETMKQSREMRARSQLDEIQFARAGQAPLVKTYKYDPTKQKVNNPPLAFAQKKDQI